MARPRYFDVPERMRQLWPWVKAFDAYDFGDASRLSELIARSETIPAEAREAIADIVSGRRKAIAKATPKLKVGAAKRLRIAGLISSLLQEIDDRKRDVQEIADREGVEPIQMLARITAERDRLEDQLVAELGVSRETIKNLRRHFRKKVEAFPKL